MEWIKLTPENRKKEHICCAISGNKNAQAAARKAELAQGGTG